MRILRLLVGMMACGCFVTGVGCASNVEKHFGEAYAENNAAMIADPEAGHVIDDGVSDLEGTTVEHVMETYRKGQKQQKSKNIPTSVLIQGMSGS
jgi:type IV pilus biogenesis protein CpaD/CtpE